METIYSQRYNYAIITPIKNYTKLTEKKYVNGNTYGFDLDDLDELNVEKNEVKKGIVYSLPKVKNKHQFYFSMDNNLIAERFGLQYYSENKNEFFTDNDRQIKRHYGNPFSDIQIYTSERSIKMDDEKITINIYEQSKHRKFNHKFFKKNINRVSVTFNIKNNNITFCKYIKNKVKTSTIFRNMLSKLGDDVAFYLFNSKYIDFKDIKNEELKDKLTSIIDNKEFIIKIYETLGIDTTNNKIGDKDLFIHDILMYFVNKKRIKIPNGPIDHLLIYLYPTEKFLKKNDRKLISSILDSIGIKSKFSIKIFHQYPKIDIQSYSNLCKIFGEHHHKYLGNLNSKHFFVSRFNLIPGVKKSILDFEIEYILSDLEKDNILSVMNSSPNSFLKQTEIIVLVDHLSMIGELKQYDPKLYFKSKTYEEYKSYHTYLSTMIAKVKKGWSYEYTFSDRMVKTIEEPITILIENNLVDDSLPPISLTFYPYILKREEEYDEEGSFMHHCVASYTGKNKSIIISVRTEDKLDRVTCEYNCQNGVLIQARHFCNGKPPLDIEVAIENLNLKVKNFATLGMLHSIEQKKVPFMVSGVEVNKPSPRTFGNLEF